jgi:hypothetical protein
MVKPQQQHPPQSPAPLTERGENLHICHQVSPSATLPQFPHL